MNDTACTTAGIQQLEQYVTTTRFMSGVLVILPQAFACSVIAIDVLALHLQG